MRLLSAAAVAITAALTTWANAEIVCDSDAADRLAIQEKALSILAEENNFHVIKVRGGRVVVVVVVVVVW